MPFYKIEEVKDEFYKVFLSKATKETRKGMPVFRLGVGDGVEVDLRFYGRGGGGWYLEEVEERYPCMVLQDLGAEIDRERLLVEEWEEGAVDRSGGKVQKVFFPIPMRYNFQVSVVGNSTKEMEAMFEWVVRTFETVKGNGFLLLKKVAGGDFGDLGEVVNYGMEYRTISREDRRYEGVFEIKLRAFVHLTAAEWSEMVEEIRLSMKQERSNFVEVVSIIKEEEE